MAAVLLKLLRGKKRRTIHNVLLSRESTFFSSSSCFKKTFATGRAVYVHDYRQDNTWAAGTVRARRNFVLYEVSVDRKICVSSESSLAPVSSWTIENGTGPLAIILDVFGLSPLGNSGTSENQPDGHFVINFQVILTIEKCVNYHLFNLR